MHNQETTLKLRAVLDTFPPYVPGKAPQEVPGLTPYRLSSNENYLEPLAAVKESFSVGFTRPTRYPDDAAVALRNGLAETFGLRPENFIVSTGASEILVSITQISSDAHTSAVYPTPSFEMYPQVTGLAGAKRHEIPVLADGRHDLEGMLAAIDATTSLVFLCSPNNPTGPALSHAEVKDFLQRVPGHVIVALDEAYWEFVNDPAAVRSLELLPEHENLVIVRTFSKAHGLAGLRVGYAIASPTIITALHKAVIPFGVTDPSQRAALVSLAHHDEVLERARSIAQARDGVAEALRKQGWQVPSVQGNFVWLPLGAHSAAFEQAAVDQALAVRNLSDGVRISIGVAEANERILAVAAQFLAQRGKDLGLVDS